MGEWFALQAPRAFVLRVESLFGGPAAKSSIDRIVQAVVADREVKVFRDRTVSPSYVVDVVAATTALLERAEPGLYHCVNTGIATWYDVGVEIARLVGKEQVARLQAVAVADAVLRAPRPKFAALANGKLARAAFQMPTWQDALRRYLT
jgi:dTDP-4-dehydrorhamnose reductase